ncbi:alanine racemase [Kaistia algarum]|uniref:alanine racemase n=1 Tax=Kaistia algarum TaxID=2083279 RepID=UPI000CE7FF2B|nr:alanine racemase [Kaistia algarum]MCX5511995.1 alanine racemase [Kaistia algarum]PPE80573.1 alanine racemase [Kaistia algarum]
MNPIAQAEAAGPADSSRLTIDLGALVGNWRHLARLAGQAETAAAVKGDAYGMGLEPTGTALERAGCRSFFVALPSEGLRLRRILPRAAIYVLSGLTAGNAPALAAASLRPVLGSIEEWREWSAYRAGGGRGEAALHIDTGMNRLGLSLDEARDVSTGDWRRQGLTLVISHLACADTPGHPLNETQLKRFRAGAALFEGLPASLANSAGIHLGAHYGFDLVRPGIALYGGAFQAGMPSLDVVAKAEALVLQVRDVPAGESIGYGASQTLRRDSRIAILSAGYADGYPRIAGSTDEQPGASVFLNGRRAPLAGRLSMDLMAVDVTDVPNVKRGDWAELLGANIPVDEVASIAGTIGYELLTSLGGRYERRYVGAA